MEQVATPPRLLVYKASAGSGKTFTLAVQYIKQLILEPHAYRQILAVTFTNKATAEMKGRILSQLYGIAQADAEADGYVRELMRETQLSELAVRQAANEALHYIIHDYSRFRVETIDSFFQSVMRNLARELDLGTHLNVELNSSQAASEAIDAMIEKLRPTSQELHYLIEYIEERMDENKKWNVMRSLKSFSANLFDERYIKNGEELRKKLKDPAYLRTYKQRLVRLRQEIVSRLQDTGNKFFAILEREDLTTEDFSRKDKGVANYFRRLRDGILSEDMCNSYVSPCLTDADAWTTKTSKKKAQIAALAHEELMPLLNDAENHREERLRLLQSIRLSLEYLNDLGLLNSISEELHLQNHLKSRFLLADTNHLLNALISEGDASFIYEKIGSVIDKVMIDEFQDTSVLQWENFRILLEESLSKADGSLVVGDIKQSIYRWRGGDWSILANIDSLPTLRVDTRTLGTNWRSEKGIVEFNNAFFTGVCQVLDKRYYAEMVEHCVPLLSAYSDVVQKAARNTEQGYVKVIQNLDVKLKAEDVEAYTLRSLADEVERLIESGVAVNDMAILLRYTKHITAIADHFKENMPYRIVSDEAFQLNASQSVCILIEAMRYMAVPNDRIAFATLALAYQNTILRNEVEEHVILSGKMEEFLPEALIKQQEELRMLPLYELAERLYLIFDLQRIEGETAYLCAFYDVLSEYAQKNSSDIMAFVNEWDERLHRTAIPSGEIDGIRILSIHKSKGLEYHTVLIPFCTWNMEIEGNKEHLLWCKTSGEVQPFDELDIVPIKYKKDMALSLFEKNYQEERLQLWIDNLNLLYVAFTRACKNLVIWGDLKRGSVGELLGETLSKIEEIAFEEREYECFYGGEEPVPELVYEYGMLSPSVVAQERRVSNRLLAVPDTLDLSIRSAQPKIAFLQSNQSQAFLKGDEKKEPSEYITMGRLLHRIFSHIRTMDDVEGALLSLRTEGVIESSEQLEELRALLRKAFGHTQVQEWFDAKWLLYNECAILSKDEQGNMQTRRPDRVMVGKERTVVVDFKFGNPDIRYEEQVGEYIRLLRGMSYPQVEGYIWYVFDNKIIEVK